MRASPHLRAALAAALLWAVVDVAPRPASWWGAEGLARGEWDVLLGVRALFADPSLPVLVADVHGFGFGAWLIELAVALGGGGAAALHGAGLVLGALSAGVAAALAVRVSPDARRAARVAPWVLALGLPSWHGMASVVHASTIESVPFQLLALYLALFGERRRAASGAGLPALLAAQLSPAALPAALLALGLLVWRKRGGGWFVAAAAGGLAGLALLAPMGGDAARVFLRGYLGNARGGMINVLLSVPWAAALRVGEPAHLPPGGAVALLAVRADAVAGAVASVALLRRPGAPRLLGGVSLAMFVALGAIPAGFDTYPAAYRYWLAVRLLWAVGLIAALAELRGRLLVGVLVAALGLSGGSLWWRAAAQAPQLTAEELLFAAGAHRMAPLQDRYGTHYRYLMLRGAAPQEARASLALGYGVLLGTMDRAPLGAGRRAAPLWLDTAAVVGEREAAAIRAGGACSYVRHASAELPELLAQVPPGGRFGLAYGAARCATGPLPALGSEPGAAVGALHRGEGLAAAEALLGRPVSGAEVAQSRDATPAPDLPARLLALLGEAGGRPNP